METQKCKKRLGMGMFSALSLFLTLLKSSACRKRIHSWWRIINAISNVTKLFCRKAKPNDSLKLPKYLLWSFVGPRLDQIRRICQNQFNYTITTLLYSFVNSQSDWSSLFQSSIVILYWNFFTTLARGFFQLVSRNK